MSTTLDKLAGNAYATLTAAEQAYLCPPYALPAEWFPKNTILRGHLAGRISTPGVSAGDIRFQVTLDGTRYPIDETFTPDEAEGDFTSVMWMLDFSLRIRAVGTMGRVIAYGMFQAENVAGGAPKILPLREEYVDTTSALSVRVYYTPETARCSITCMDWVLELV